MEFVSYINCFMVLISSITITAILLILYVELMTEMSVIYVLFKYSKAHIWPPVWWEIRNLIWRTFFLLFRMLNVWFSIFNNIYKHVIFYDILKIWYPKFGNMWISIKYAKIGHLFGTFLQFLSASAKATLNKCFFPLPQLLAFSW